MSQIIEEIRLAKHQRWMRDWKNGLAYCKNCGEEYIDIEVVIIDEEKSCPHCKVAEDKHYYYCPDEGWSECECH